MRQVYDSEELLNLLPHDNEEVSQPLLAMHHFGLIEVWADDGRICMVKSTQKMEDFNEKLRKGISPEELKQIITEYVGEVDND
jgi:quinol monooxygenase YgiN